jgi:hypothetical protein
MTVQQFQEHLDNWLELYRKDFGSDPTIQDFSIYTTFTSLTSSNARSMRQVKVNDVLVNVD